MTESKIYYVYRHIRLDTNEVFYVGIGTIQRKFSYSRAFSKSRNKFWKNITSKTEYDIEIMLESDDYEWIKQKEIEFIALYGRKNLGKGTLVNLTDGGDGNHNTVVSIETRIKKSEIARQLGIKPPNNIGKPRSQETKHKISISKKGKKNNKIKGLNNHKSTPVSQIDKILKTIICVYESILQASEKTGISRSKIEKNIKNNKGQGGGYNWEQISINKYNNLKDNYKTVGKNIPFCQKITIIAESQNGDKSIYNSISEAARDLNISSSNIVAVLKNKRNHCKNIKFYYL